MREISNFDICVLILESNEVQPSWNMNCLLKAKWIRKDKDMKKEFIKKQTTRVPFK